MGEYALKLYFYLFNKKTCASLISFFTYYAWKPMHMGSTKFNYGCLGNYCEFVTSHARCNLKAIVIITKQKVAMTKFEFDGYNNKFDDNNKI